jgi:hypothetical protein
MYSVRFGVSAAKSCGSIMMAMFLGSRQARARRVAARAGSARRASTIQ